MIKATRLIYIMVSFHTVRHPGQPFMESASMHQMDSNPSWCPCDWPLHCAISLMHRA